MSVIEWGGGVGGGGSGSRGGVGWRGGGRGGGEEARMSVKVWAGVGSAVSTT